MARERERRGRAAERAQAERQQRLIYIGAGAVLGVAALLIVAGLFITRYLPPRANVLTVAGQSYQAREAVDFGTYFFLDTRFSNIGDSARQTIDVLLEDEALRRYGADTVEAVTAADIDRELNIDLGLIADDPDPAADAGDPDAEASATAEATPTAEPTPVATIDAQEFANALTGFLRTSGLSRDQYEAVIEARLYRERLTAHFTEEVGASGAQVRLQRIRLSTQLAADSAIEELEGGADFVTLADEQSVAEEDGDGGEIGWTTRELQTDDVQAAIATLAAGEWSAPITAGLFFEIYLLAEIAEDRAYDDTTITPLVENRVGAWVDEAVAQLEFDNDLSADEESWINERVLADVTSRFGG